MKLKRGIIALAIAIVVILEITILSVIQNYSDLSNNWHDQIILEQSLLLFSYDKLIDKQTSLEHYIFKQAFDKDFLYGTDHEKKHTWVFIPKLTELHQKFIDKQITCDEYLKQGITITSKHYHKLRKRFRREFKWIRYSYDNPPTLFSMNYKDIIAICYKIHALSIVSILLLFLYLLKTIDKLNLTGVENKCLQTKREVENLKKN